MTEVDIANPLPTLTYKTHSELVWLLVRLGTEPIGSSVLALEGQCLAAEKLGQYLWSQFRQAITDRFADAKLPIPNQLSAHGVGPLPNSWPFLRDRRQALAEPPFISVIICTRNRSEQLKKTLRSLESIDYRTFEIIIVDNSADSIEAEISGMVSYPKIRYVAEPVPGLSRARNAGIRAALGEVIAFLDDDEEPDQYWLDEVARGFARDPNIGCVSGMILPARIETSAQECFENIGGHSKGRGFSHAVFSSVGPQNPLFPRPPFGAGGNFAFRRDVIAKIGGFDEALGAGTPARAGEDTLALTLTLLEGYMISYEPAAFVRHDHYEQYRDLARQLRGYGVGLTAFYTALLRRRPSTIPGLVGLLLQAMRYLTGHVDRSVGQKLPKDLTLQHRIGLLTGPLAYIRSSYIQRRLVRRASH